MDESRIACAVHDALSPYRGVTCAMRMITIDIWADAHCE